MTGIDLHRESFAEVIADALPVLRAHWAEVVTFPRFPFDLDVAGYERLDAAGMLRIFTGRIDGRLIAYASFVVCRHAHYAGSGDQARLDAIYVLPEYRGRYVGMHLIRYCDGMLAAEGVSAVFHGAPVAEPTFANLLMRCGYRPVETIWCKQFKETRDEGSGIEAINANNLNPEPTPADREELYVT